MMTLSNIKLSVVNRMGLRPQVIILSLVAALGLSLMGCDKGSKHQNKKMSERMPTPAEKLDWTQPYQPIAIGEVIVKIPTGHITIIHEDSVVLEARIVINQEGRPRFLTGENVEEIQKLVPFDTYNNVFIYVNKTHFDVKQSSIFDEESAIHKSLSGPINPPITMEDLGLKQYTRVKGAPIAVYIPLDPNFTKLGGGVFSLSCDPMPSDPKTVAGCHIGFVPKDKVNVRYSFPPQYLRYWKEVHQFVLDALQFTN